MTLLRLFFFAFLSVPEELGSEESFPGKKEALGPSAS